MDQVEWIEPLLAAQRLSPAPKTFASPIVSPPGRLDGSKELGWAFVERFMLPSMADAGKLADFAYAQL